jgi:hypothetical protein
LRRGNGARATRTSNSHRRPELKRSANGNDGNKTSESENRTGFLDVADELREEAAFNLVLLAVAHALLRNGTGRRSMQETASTTRCEMRPSKECRFVDCFDTLDTHTIQATSREQPHSRTYAFLAGLDRRNRRFVVLGELVLLRQKTTHVVNSRLPAQQTGDKQAHKTTLTVA